MVTVPYSILKSIVDGDGIFKTNRDVFQRTMIILVVLPNQLYEPLLLSSLLKYGLSSIHIWERKDLIEEYYDNESEYNDYVDYYETECKSYGIVISRVSTLPAPSGGADARKVYNLFTEKKHILNLTDRNLLRMLNDPGYLLTYDNLKEYYDSCRSRFGFKDPIAYVASVEDFTKYFIDRLDLRWAKYADDTPTFTKLVKTRSSFNRLSRVDIIRYIVDTMREELLPAEFDSYLNRGVIRPHTILRIHEEHFPYMSVDYIFAREFTRFTAVCKWAAIVR